ncbi:MAG: histidine phosphatase family protein [Bacteroidota bacterium]
MSQLTVIRHAQASLGKANYDELSPLGLQQAQLLANYLVEQNMRFDQIYTGTLYRHQQTATAIQKAYQRQRWSYSLIRLSDFNEHQSPKVAKWILQRALSNEKHKELDFVREILSKVQSTDPIRQYLAIFDAVAIAWGSGKIDTSATNIEPFLTFKTRVHTALQKILIRHQHGQRICIVTSGGPTAAITGEALHLTNAKIMELNGLVYNGSMTHFLYDADRFSLQQFNSIPHLEERVLRTIV